MECVNMSWLLNPWLLGGLIGAFITLVLIAAVADLKR